MSRQFYTHYSACSGLTVGHAGKLLLSGGDSHRRAVAVRSQRVCCWGRVRAACLTHETPGPGRGLAHSLRIQTSHFQSSLEGVPGRRSSSCYLGTRPHCPTSAKVRPLSEVR